MAFDDAALNLTLLAALVLPPYVVEEASRLDVLNAPSKPAVSPTITDRIQPVMLGPNITGSRVMLHDFIGAEWQGALSGLYLDADHKTVQIPASSLIDKSWLYSFDASRSNSLYGASSTVQPAADAVQYLIKY